MSEIIYISNGYSDGYLVYDEAECPNCGRQFEEDAETWKCNYCPNCGEELDWRMEYEKEN